MDESRVGADFHRFQSIAMVGSRQWFLQSLQAGNLGHTFVALRISFSPQNGGRPQALTDPYFP